jgi:hypothetical protein
VAPAAPDHGTNSPPAGDAGNRVDLTADLAILNRAPGIHVDPSAAFTRQATSPGTFKQVG